LRLQKSAAKPSGRISARQRSAASTRHAIAFVGGRFVRPSFYFGNSNIPSNSDKHIYGFTMKFRLAAKIA
jgi:hypothetical protein